MSGFVDSQFKFTDPIRYFKQNDPYFWAVENIPLKQLQENCLWLKDQILGQDNAPGFSRSDFNELKPSSEGGNNKILVQPGRFTARINDAYTKSPMQILAMATGTEAGQYETFNNPAGQTIAQAILDSLKGEISNQFDGFNGLMERVLSWPMFDEDTPSRTSTSILDENGNPTFSDIDGVVWPLQSKGLFQDITQNYGAAKELQRLTLEFTKQFRGAGRTAVVDVPEQLSIEIPNFSDDDFIYVDGDGVQRQISGAEVRIDLLFIYSKPIDASSTTINKWSGGQPTVITTPILGLVKGAGVGIRQGSTTNADSEWIASPDFSNEGHTQIVPNVADQFVTTNGFQLSSIHGSFPSPDDLMNLAPLISEGLEMSDPQLIGQSILPIAYVVVRKTADINAIGNVVLTDNDLFDIRPFFRTTELTYGERAGIMAATPPLSMANPVVTQFGLDHEARKLRDYADHLFDVGYSEKPRSVGAGVIWGGRTYGPEGAINALLTAKGITGNQFPDTVPALPDWDIAEWWDFDNQDASNGGLQKGELRNDRINQYVKGSNANLDGGVSVPAGFLAVLENEDGGLNTGNLLFNWIKKRIPINKENVGWMTDYVVRVGLENCVGITSKSDGSYGIAKSGAYGIWVERKPTEFIIYVGWSANKVDQGAGYPQLVRSSPMLTQWIAKSSYFPNPTSGAKQSFLAACTYPTVTFEVIGYPTGWFNTSLPQYPNTPLLTLQ